MSNQHGASAEAEWRAFRKALQRGGDIHGFFDKGEIVVVRVPSRLDVMGGIADYSGADVCQFPLAHGAVTGIQKRRDDRIRLLSVGIETHGHARDFEMSLSAFRRGSRLLDYPAARQLFEGDARRRWAAYVAGSIFVLLKEKRVARLEHGFNIAMESHVPMNVGIASSATVEVSTLYAVDQVLNLGLDPVDLGRLGQMAENRVVGAPCGIMDQLAVACGKRGKLLHILCQPDIVRGTVEAPEFCEFAGINSMVKHSVGGEKYTDTRVATFMGRKIIFDRLRRCGGLKPGEEPFGGYLCNIEMEDYARVYRPWLPERLTGAAFLRRHKSTDDPVAPVDPAKTYHVESRTSHPIHETARVRRFMSRLHNARLTGDRRFLEEAGRLMYASHWSYARKCGQSCDEADFLVNLVRRMGPRWGLYGAKITGGGSGGTVAVMGEREKIGTALERIVAAYRKACGHVADVFMGSSEGACEFGSVRWRA